MGPDQGDLVTVVSMVALLLTIVAVIIYTSQRAKTQRQSEDEERRRAIDAGVKQGVCDKDGNPLCVVCKKLGEDTFATEFSPITGQSCPRTGNLALICQTQTPKKVPTNDPPCDEHLKPAATKHRPVPAQA